MKSLPFAPISQYETGTNDDINKPDFQMSTSIASWQNYLSIALFDMIGCLARCKYT